MPELDPLMSYAYTMVEIGPTLAYTLQCIAAAVIITGVAAGLAIWRKK